jgi:hypothetical protein
MNTFLFRLAVALFFFCHAGALRAADSVNKRANNAFDVTNMFTHEEGTIKLINAVGYKGTYTDALPHTVYVVHAINGDKGFQVILDTTTDTFGTIDAEFLAILHSLRVK